MSVFDKIYALADQVEKGSTTELDDRARACRDTKEMLKDTKALLESVRVQLSEGWHGGAGEAALTSLEAFKKNRDDQAQDLEESAKSFETIRDALAKAQQDARSKRADAQAPPEEARPRLARLRDPPGRPRRRLGAGQGRQGPGPRPAGRPGAGDDHL